MIGAARRATASGGTPPGAPGGPAFRLPSTVAAAGSGGGPKVGSALRAAPAPPAPACDPGESAAVKAVAPAPVAAARSAGPRVASPAPVAVTAVSCATVAPPMAGPGSISPAGALPGVSG